MDISENLKILRAEESHIPVLLTLWKELMQFHEPFDRLFEISEDAKNKMAEGWKRHLKDDNHLILLAVNGDIPVGYLTASLRMYPPVFKIKTYVEVSDIAVFSNLRRQGIGESLLEEALKWSRSKQAERIECKVAKNNNVSYSFWKKHGFTDYLHQLYLNLE